MSTSGTDSSVSPKRLSPSRKKAGDFWNRIMMRYGTVLLTLAAAAVTVIILALLWIIPRHQQDFHSESQEVETAVTMLCAQELSAEQQRKLQWVLQTQDPALLTRGDHPHSYAAMWKKQKTPSAVTAPSGETPQFSPAQPAPFVPLKNPVPKKDELQKFVPRPVAAPAAVKEARPLAFDERGRALPQLLIEPVNKPVTGPTRLILRKQGPLTLPQLLESCGVPDLDELAMQQVVSAMPRLGEIREITIYWNKKEVQP